MATMALAFVAFTLLVLFLLLVASAYFVPRVLGEEEIEESEQESRGSGQRGRRRSGGSGSGGDYIS
ncbi:MAG: hypothetical protein ABEH56_05400 [Salinirussus sp.]